MVSLCYLLSFSFDGYVPHRDLHSFPTRRSSDLSMLAPGFYWLVAAQMLLGFGVSVTRVVSLMVVVAATPRTEQGRANNLLEFVAIAGFTLSPTLSGLTASLLHWRIAFCLATVFVAGAFAWLVYTRQGL